MLVCGRQNIALRGHRDDSKDYDSPNPALLNFRIRSGNFPLKKHFNNVPKNATCRSKTIQNQPVSVDLPGWTLHPIFIPTLQMI